MSLTALFGLLGGLLVLAFVANRLFHRTRVPDVVVLMAAGLLLGPVLGWVDAEDFDELTRAFGTLAIILILFEGGLELNLRETLGHSPGGLLFGLLTYFLSLGFVTLVLHWGLHLSLTAALLAGAVFACTSIAVVLPVLQQMKVREPVKVTLLLEASLGEVFAVLTVGILLEQAAHEGPLVSGLLQGFLSETAVALLLAVAAGYLWSRLLPRLSKEPFWQVLTFSVVLLLYAASEAVHASGFIAVFAFGLTLAHLSTIGPRMVEATFGLEAPIEEHHEKILSFHAELAFLVRTFFFVLIGVVVEFTGLGARWWLMLGILGAIFLARWLAVQATGRVWRALEPGERELHFWMMPRGLITAILAIQVVETGGRDFAFLPAMAFAIILVTNLAVVWGNIRAARQVPEPAPAEPAPPAAG
ncbi:MAG: cation:proton antiporter [Terriglobia bacterium]